MFSMVCFHCRGFLLLGVPPVTVIKWDRIGQHFLDHGIESGVTLGVDRL